MLFHEWVARLRRLGWNDTYTYLFWMNRYYKNTDSEFEFVKKCYNESSWAFKVWVYETLYQDDYFTQACKNWRKTLHNAGWLDSYEHLALYKYPISKVWRSLPNNTTPLFQVGDSVYRIKLNNTQKEYLFVTEPLVVETVCNNRLYVLSDGYKYSEEVLYTTPVYKDYIPPLPPYQEIYIPVEEFRNALHYLLGIKFDSSRSVSKRIALKTGDSVQLARSDGFVGATYTIASYQTKPNQTRSWGV